MLIKNIIKTILVGTNLLSMLPVSAEPLEIGHKRSLVAALNQTVDLERVGPNLFKVNNRICFLDSEKPTQSIDLKIYDNLMMNSCPAVSAVSWDEKKIEQEVKAHMDLRGYTLLSNQGGLITWGKNQISGNPLVFAISNKEKDSLGRWRNECIWTKFRKNNSNTNNFKITDKDQIYVKQILNSLCKNAQDIDKE